MSTTFSLYKPLTPPQSITHAVQAQFLAPGSNDIIAIRHNYIEIYHLPSHVFEAQQRSALDGNGSVGGVGGLTDSTLLERKFDARLFGNVEGICSVRLPGWSRDCILLTYPHSKLSLCAWDMGTREIITLCIWSQDEEVIEKERERIAAGAPSKHGPATQNQIPKSLPTQLITQVKKYIQPVLRVDPQNRCAALMTFDAYLHIFDLSVSSSSSSSSSSPSSLTSVQSGLNTSATGATSYYAQAPLAFSSLDGIGSMPSLASPSTYSLAALGLGTITDMAFLYGFEDPTLLILHERKRTWEGRYAAARLTQELSCVTFHLRTQGFSLIGSVANVSHDAFAIHPIPMPLGGALIVQQNLLVHWNNNAFDYALAVNEHGAGTAKQDKMPHFDVTPLVLKLDQSRFEWLHVFIDRAIGLLSSNDGIGYLVTIEPSGTSVRSMSFEPIGHIPRLTGMIRLRNLRQERMLMLTQSYLNQHNLHATTNMSNFLFLYSYLGPTLLLEVRRSSQEDLAKMKREEDEERKEEEEEKRLKQMKEEATKKAQQAAAQATVTVKMDTDSTPLPSFADRLDAASSDGPSDSSSSTGVNNVKVKSDPDRNVDNDNTGVDDDAIDVIEPAAKRSKLDDLYREMTGKDMADDELMEVFGFDKAGAAKKKEEEEAAAAEALKKASNTAAAAPITSASDSAKEAELMVAQAALDRENARLASLDRSLRTPKEFHFFIRDRLTCVAPTSDLVVGYAQPSSSTTSSEDDAATESLQRAFEEEMARRAEIPHTKPTNDEEERALFEKERRDMFELQKHWREKERKSRVIEFMQLTGYGDAGAISLSYEGIMPDVITASPLQRRCVGSWALRAGTPYNANGAGSGPVKKSKKRFTSDETHHSLLLITTPIHTLVIQTGTELQELTSGNHGFYNGRTIFAGNISTTRMMTPPSNTTPTSQLNDDEVEAIVQVYQTGFRIVQGGVMTHELLLPTTTAPDTTPAPSTAPSLTIISAAIESGYMVLRMSDSSLRLFRATVSLTASAGVGGSKLELLGDWSSTKILQDCSTITTMCLFTDHTIARAIKTRGGGGDQRTNANGPDVSSSNGPQSMDLDLDDALLGGSGSAPSGSNTNNGSDDLDDLDRLLGGGDGEDAPTDVKPMIDAKPIATSKTNIKSAAGVSGSSATTNIVPPDVYLVVAHSGRIEFYLLPTLECLYSIERFALCKKILTHTQPSSNNNNPSATTGTNVDASKLDPTAFHLPDSSLPRILDVCVTNMSRPTTAGGVGDGGLPTMFAILENGDTLVYEAFTTNITTNTNNAHDLRWSKSELTISTRPFLNSKGTSSSGTFRDAFGPSILRSSSSASSSNRIQQTRFEKLPNLLGPRCSSSGSSSNHSNSNKYGILLTGTKPYLFFQSRGRIRSQPFLYDTKPRLEDTSATSATSSAAAASASSSSFEGEEDVEIGEGEELLDEEEDEELSEDVGTAHTSSNKRKGLLTATPFHNPNCPYGFIYFDWIGTLHMACLPPSTKLPNHSLFLTKRRMLKLGLGMTPLLTSLSSNSTLGSSISLTPFSYDYDTPFLTRHVHLGSTPIFVTRHLPTSTIVVVLATQVRVPSLELETERSLPQYESKYSVIIFSSTTWEILGRFSEFETHEMVLCMTKVCMNSKQYICLGTSEYVNEDTSTRGRIIMIDLYHTLGNSGLIDPSTGQQSQVKLLKLKVSTQAEKLPVTSITQLAENILVTGQGSRIILYRHTGRQLAGIAFFDCQMYITSLTCLNHFILYGDIQRGLHLLYWDPILKTLTHLGRSNESFHVNSCEFLLDYKNLNLVVTDEQSNLQIFKWIPNTPSNAANKVQMASYENIHAQNPNTQTLKESTYTSTSLLGGLGYKLNLKSDFHLGERIGKMIKLKLRTRGQVGGGGGGVGGASSTTGVGVGVSSNVGSPSKLARQLSAVTSNVAAKPIQSYLLMSSYGGALSQLLPIDQLIFRRLNTLVIQMTNSIRQIGGLNPLAYRLFQAAGSHHPHFAKKLLDATLLFAYPQLDIELQWQLAKHIGTTPAQIIENIKAIEWTTQCH